MCKGRKNPRGLMDQFTNTVQYSTVQYDEILREEKGACAFHTLIIGFYHISGLAL